MSSSEATVDQDDARSDFLAQSMRSERDGSQRPRLHTLDTDNLAYHTSTAGGSNPTETIFAQLQIIKELQGQISSEHAQLEGLDGHDMRAGAEEKNVANGTSSPLRSHENYKGQNDDSGIGPGTERRAAAEAYDKLAARFEERQKGVESIMGKLSQLSKAVKDFHALPAPVLFPDSHVLKSGKPFVDTPITMSTKQQQRRFD